MDNTQEIETLKEKVKDLEKNLEMLEQRRTGQQMIIPGAIKMRHMGEANKFVRSGSAANKPTTGETGTDSLAIYYDETNHKLWVYDGGWKGVTLS